MSREYKFKVWDKITNQYLQELDMETETITITRAEYQRLLEDSNKLLALESVGVDSWKCYDEAMELFKEINEDREEK